MNTTMPISSVRRVILPARIDAGGAVRAACAGSARAGWPTTLIRPP